MKSQMLAGVTLAALCVAAGGCVHRDVKTAQTTPPTPTSTTSSTGTNRPAASTPTPARNDTATTPRSNMPDEATKARIQDLLNRIQDAYFDYDKHTIRADAQAALQKDAQTLGEILRQYPDYKLTVEGYCDERGSEEYNLALGDARAKQAKDYLATIGVPGNQLRTISFGKDRPVCTEHDEACWQKNRRAHITQEQQ